MVKKSLITIGILICLFSSTIGAVEIYPLSQVYPGLKGIGKTVVQGTTIEDFDVEVLSIIPQPSPTSTLIMVRVSGEAIERSGGIASGMSGSPVYIDNKLLGAIGYGYEYSDHRIGLVTPAAQMLALLENVPINNELIIPSGFSEIKTPLMVSGIQGRALKMLKDTFEPYNAAVIPGVSGIVDQFNSSELEPGSAFAVQLLRGDFQVAAFGTITEIDEHNRFVGFGHPFLHKGNVNYFVAPAVIHQTLPNLEFPFKIASAGPSAGTVYQDRAAGVGGVLHYYSDYIPIMITVEDVTRNIQDSYRVESIVDDSLINALAISSAYQGVDSTLDRIGAGTAYVRVEFFVRDLLNPIIRENMFYSDTDIAVWALSDLSEGIDLITSNTLQHVELEKINTEIVIKDERKTAEIEKAIPRLFQVKAGDSIEVEVKIRPYRQPVENRILRIEIPEDTLPGPMTVSVRGGGMGYYAIKPTVHTTWQSLEQDDTEEMWQEPTQAESFDILMAKYVDREQNNEIVAEFYPFIDTYTYEEPEPEVNDTVIYNGETIPVSEVELLEQDYGHYYWENADTEPIRVRLNTQYVIEGSASFEIEVI